MFEHLGTYINCNFPHVCLLATTTLTATNACCLNIENTPSLFGQTLFLRTILSELFHMKFAISGGEGPFLFPFSFFANSRGPDNSTPKKFGLNFRVLKKYVAYLKAFSQFMKWTYQKLKDHSVLNRLKIFCHEKSGDWNPKSKLDSITKQILKKICTMTQILSTIEII